MNDVDLNTKLRHQPSRLEAAQASGGTRMSREYLDWKTIEEDIVVPEQAAIAVYNNPAGGIVLRQARDSTARKKTPR
jgi:hypothetical protein